jgi:hypothetical protein
MFHHQSYSSSSVMGVSADIHLEGLPRSPGAGFPYANNLGKIADFDTLSSSA